MRIQPITDIVELSVLLQACSLPVSDLKTNKDCMFFDTYNQDRLEASVGIEVYDHLALLRSLAVSPLFRSRGVGAKLVLYVEEICRSKGVDELFLLTTTADSYFLSHGYHVVDRADVPLHVKESTQFTSVCPDSAIVMSKNVATG